MAVRFPLAQAPQAVPAGKGAILAAACCRPAIVLPKSAARRATLADLDLHEHCSIVGTCLATAELRRLVTRHVPHLDRQRASDLDIHHAAVELCCQPGAGRKDINKALDTRHAPAIRRFKSAADDAALGALWREAMANGDIPGAYWAVMTHPCATPAVRAQAFGDVHMLSHLVGASNRADIRRLVALEQECADLKERNERQQARLRDLGAEHAAERRRLEARIHEFTVLNRDDVGAAALRGEVDWLRTALARRDEAAALHAARQAAAESRLETSERSAADLRAMLARVEQELAESRAEGAALEQALTREADQGEDGGSALPRLDGVCLAYIGGRPAVNAVLARLVAAAGGELLLHDGGVEQRSGTLAAVVARADEVVFPVDCISHGAMHVLKRLCAQAGVAWHPVRSASVASFVLLIEKLLEQPPAASPPASHFCLHHG